MTRHPSIIAAAIVLALCVLTYSAIVPQWRYATVTTDLIGQPALSAQLDRWYHNGAEAAAEGGVVTARLAPGAPGRIALMTTRMAIPRGSDALRAVVDVRAEGMVPGPNGWQIGWAQIWTFDDAGNYLWYWPKDVASLSGDTDWLTFEAVIPVTRGVAAGYLAIVNGALSGTLHLRGVRVAALEERWTSIVVRSVLLALWTFVGLWVCRMVLHSGQARAPRALVIALGAVTLAATLTPQPYFERANAPIQSLLRTWMTSTERAPRQAQARAPETLDRAPAAPADGAGVPPRFTKGAKLSFRIGFKEIGHFAVFFLLALATMAAYPRVGHGLRIVYLSVFALVSECLQLFPITRSPTLSDLAVDISGILVAIAVAVTLRRAVSALRPPLSGNASPGAKP